MKLYRVSGIASAFHLRIRQMQDVSAWLGVRQWTYEGSLCLSGKGLNAAAYFFATHSRHPSDCLTRLRKSVAPYATFQPNN